MSHPKEHMMLFLGFYCFQTEFCDIPLVEEKHSVKQKRKGKKRGFRF